ncbi:MAG: hypothetical protein J7559_07620 [Cohnella sp.]|nr:hypothetical protein [Cohnella sp.]
MTDSSSLGSFASKPTLDEVFLTITGRPADDQASPESSESNEKKVASL